MKGLFRFYKGSTRITRSKMTLPESRAKKEEQVSNKLQYLMAIKNGLLNNKNKIPNLKVAIDIINSIVVDYNKPVIKL